MKLVKLLPICLCFLYFSCEKECDNEGFSFGDTQSGFVVDSVYKTDADGLLYVFLDARTNIFYISIYADMNPSPEEKVSSICQYGSITYPLEKDTYWKVTYDRPDLVEPYLDTVEINWTPIE